eukprot:3356253-Prymnesium_polylepis.1
MQKSCESGGSCGQAKSWAHHVMAGPGVCVGSLRCAGAELGGGGARVTRRKPRWTAKCRFYKR